MAAATALASAPPQTTAFVERFRAAWALGRAGFGPAWEPAMHDDVLLTQPLAPPARGLDGFRAQFSTLFGAIPDLRGEVLRWTPNADGVTIEIELRGTFAGRPVAFVSTDRIVLDAGRMRERHAQFNPLPLVRAAVLRPHRGLPLLLGARRAGGDSGAGAASVGGSSGWSAGGPAGPRCEESVGGKAGWRGAGGSGVGASSTGLDRALAGLALGRIALGAASRIAPRGTARAFGAGATATPELDYMTRIFGARAIALGSGWLLSHGAARSRWQRLAFGCDVSDTIAGIGHLRRGDLPRSSALQSVALTGTYMLVGAAKVARDLRRRPT